MQVDSILTALDTASDKSKRPLYHFLSQAYSKINPDSSLYFAEKGLETATLLKDSFGISIGLTNIGIHSYLTSNFPKSIENYRRAFNIDKARRDTIRMMAHLENMANTFDKTGKFDSSQYCLTTALGICNPKRHRTSYAGLKTQLGILHFRTEEFEEALAHFEESMAFYQQNETDKAFYQKSKLFISNNLNNMGLCYKFLGNHEKSRECFEESLKMSREIGDNSQIAKRLANLGNYYKDAGQFEMAEKQLHEALDLFAGLRDSIHIGMTYSDLGVLASAQGNHTKAIVLATKALETHKRLGSLENIVNGHKNLSELHDSLGQYEKALRHHQQYALLKDSLINDTKNKTVKELQIKYETEIKEEENRALIAENEINSIQSWNMKWGIGLLGMALLAAMSTAVYLNRQKNRITRQKDEIEKQKSQINTLLTNAYHTTKNHLQVLASIIGVQNRRLENLEAKALLRENQARVEAIRNLHQQLLFNESGQASIRMNDYLQSIVDNTLRLYRSEDSYRVELSTDVEALEASHKVATALGLVAKELLTNAFKYAFTPEHPDPRIALSVKTENGALHMTVEDNGKGLPETLQDGNASGSFGMELVRLFLDNIGAKLSIGGSSGARFDIIAPNWKTA